MKFRILAGASALAAALALAGCTNTGTTGLAETSAAAPARVADPADLVAGVDIPYDRFQLANGLTVLVHTDRKAPIVGVTTYYKVGSKTEPRGRTGFAHLYEHLFFGGSANVPNFDIPLEAAGSTSTNGSTSYDRTNYVETVPTGALPLALFMESDRMGHLLPAVTQDKLDKQRGVVQNEKRQGDNQPYGLFRYVVSEGLFPVGHPYRHSVIGSMADLDAATLSDARDWFRDNYAPQNVVLVLSGDIDTATARPLVERYFGSIPAGPAARMPEAGPVTLPAPLSRDIADQVPLLMITRNWTGPGLNDAETPALDVGMSILGGLASSRLDNELVRGQELAVSASASAGVYEQVSMLMIQMQVKPGIERAAAEAALDKVIADYLAEGPTEAEVRRAVTTAASGEIGALERVGYFGGKGATLAEGELYSNDPEHAIKMLKAKAALTPAMVRDTMRKWLSRPVYKLAVVPGPRTLDGSDLGGWGDEDSVPAAKPDPKAEIAPVPAGEPRVAPPVAPVSDLDFPDVQHFTLSNGIPVSLATRGTVPKVEVALTFDAGIAADASDTPGTQGAMLDLLDQGISDPVLGDLDATRIAEIKEQLGAQTYTVASLDSSQLHLSALTANLAPSLDLIAAMAKNPAFRESDVERVRAQRLANLKQVEASPRALAARVLQTELFGTGAYAQPTDGFGDAQSVAALTPAALSAAHDKWLRPGLASIIVVGKIDMATLKPLLEERFGSWAASSGPDPVKTLPPTPEAGATRIVFVERPNSPQSVIMAGRVLPITGTSENTEVIGLANEVIGDGFLARLNTNLREEKGWSYGVRSAISQPRGPRTLMVAAPVQADKTGAAIKEIIADMTAFPATKPVTAEEFQRVTDGAIRGLPNSFETNAQVLSAIEKNQLLGRPDNYYETLASTYRGFDAEAIGAAATTYLRPENLTIVIVGDRAQVAPQLESLGLPVEYRAAPGSQ